MKKFFKGLALVLALVLVLGTIPASNASAKVYTKKTLYLNGGSAKKNTAKLYKLAGVKKADAAKVTAESADSKIVKAGSKKLTAKAEGKVDVKISVDGKLVTTVAVTVKDLAKPAEVELKAESVTQTASNAIQVVFNKEVDNLTKADFNLYYKAGDAKVYGNIINTAKQNADNKKAWDVVFFSNFQAKETYFVEVTGIELSFPAAGNSYKDVTSISIDGKDTVVVNTLSDAYKVKYYNAAGIDITSTVQAEKNFVVSMTADDVKDGYLSGNKLYFWSVGATATLKVKVEMLNAEYQYVTVAEASKTVTCISEAQRQYTGVNLWSFTSNAAGTAVIDKNFNKINTTLAVGDTKAFQVVINYALGSDKKTETLFAAPTNGSGYRFESADPTIALVNGSKALGTAPNTVNIPQVYGVKEGTTYIKIYSYDYANKIDELITAIEIKVSPARVATSMVPSWSKSNLNVANTDSAKLTIKVTDQYGEAIALPYGALPHLTSSATYVQNLGGFVETDIPAVAGKVGEYAKEFDTDDITYKQDGTYSGTVKGGKMSVGVTLSVVNNADDSKINGYKLAAVKDYDLALTKDTKVERATGLGANEINQIKLTKVSNGFYMGDVTEGDFTMASEAPTRTTGPATTIAAGTKFVYTVTKNGSYIKNDNVKFDEANTFSSKKFTLYKQDASTITKAAIGTYVVTAYKVVNVTDINKCSVERVDQVVFNITDTQLKPSFIQIKGSVASVNIADDADLAALNIFKTCYKPVFNGKTYDSCDAAAAEGYTVVGVKFHVDTFNKTIVFESVDFTIKNSKAGSDLTANTGVLKLAGNSIDKAVVYGEN